MTPTLPQCHPFIARLAQRLCVAARMPWLLLALAAVAGAAPAQEDTRRLLEQGAREQTLAREQQLLEQADADGRPTLTLDGTTYRIEHNANDVGQALYLMLQHRQWAMARRFLDEYNTLPQRDALLVHYATALLARQDGQHARAVAELTALLALKPDFLLARLELARTLFEDQQDREAGQLFDAIAASLDEGDERSAGVRTTVATFQKALRNRRSWQGSASMGPQWSDNVNRTTASRTCMVFLGGECVWLRQTPDPISAWAADYDAVLSRRQPLAGHHGLYVRALAYGQSYRNAAAWNEASLAVQAGYSYRSAAHMLSLAPSFDYYAWGNRALYGALGAHAEWSWLAARDAMFKVEADWKDLRYRNAVLADNYDGANRALYATWYQGIGKRWMLFGGVDISDGDAPRQMDAWLQRGARVGATLQWPQGFNATAMASLRQRSYRAYNSLLAARRQDDEQNYTLVIKATRWALAGFTPVFTLRRNVVHSNVDWLYSHDRHAASVKLERAF